MASNVSEKEARQVAEAAREQDWDKPSFAKELFLGRFRLDLIHPHPAPAADEKGEAFLARLRDFLASEVDPPGSSARPSIPDEVIDGLKELGALGMKIPTSTAASASPRSTTTAPSPWSAPGTRRSPRCSPPISRSAYRSR